MRNLFVLGILAAVLASCSTSGNGELIGVQNRPIWNPTDPYGMVYLPQGSFNMGPGDQDVPYAHVTQHKTVSVAAFYMDETEITNNEYRQFVNWVRDSIARVLLGEAGVPGYELVEEDKYGNFIDPPRIDWDRPIRWDDQEVREILEDEMYLPEHERFYSRRQLDSRKLNFVYETQAIKDAARKLNRKQGQKDRSVFIDEVEINIYPDTLVWTHDYAYSYNDPWTKNYFHHPAFDEYPVVGVNWKQAVAFSKWRTKILDEYLLDRDEPLHDEFRLPTESEWEYAARGGLDLSPYPWGGPYTTNDKGCFLANFKPRRGNYTADGGIRTVRVGSYNPNNYGLYDMAGNVSEWTDNTYDESAFSFAHDMNMDFKYEAEDSDPNILKRKTIRGGSWKDISHYIQVGTRDYEYQDTAKSYIGFRNVISFLGRDKVDFR
ncbi:MAG: gliding motility-associated lipoprotein [Flavobacteriales bacterium]|nr:gliding motility-associated lipoprotein [Flavobacteriales bacterium]|tara:strand:- start:2319 stop:3617 length:1299 start_codon:yes stop_codon:yes gene_type:complete